MSERTNGTRYIEDLAVSRKRAEGQAERRRHLDENVEVVGFGRNSGWIKDRAAQLGFPVDNISRLRSSSNTRETKDVLGSFTYRGEDEGTLDIYKHKENLKPIVLFGVLVHEFQHENTPLDKKNAFLYGSEANRANAANFATSAAKQAEATQVFLNPYHKSHFQRLTEARARFERGEKNEEDRLSLEQSEWLFQEETLAIMSELRLANPEHLCQVEQAQMESLARRTRGGEVDLPEGIHLISSAVSDPLNSGQGIDRVLIDLFAEVNNLQELNLHIATQRQAFMEADITFDVDNVAIAA